MSFDEIVFVKPRLGEKYYYIDNTFEGIIKISDTIWENKHIETDRLKYNNVFIVYEQAHMVFEEILSSLKKKGISI